MKVRIIQIPKAQDGMSNPFDQLAELEKGEIYETTDGSIDKVPESAQTHEQGGHLVPNASRILEDTSDKRKDEASKELKMTPDEVESATGFKPKSSLTHSKAFEKSAEYWDRQLKKLEKKIQKNYDYAKDTDSTYAMNSLDLNMKLIDDLPTQEELFNGLFEHQESVKSHPSNAGIFKDGGYNRYGPETQKLIKEGKLKGISDKDWVGTQHQSTTGAYGTAAEEDFKQRHPWFFNKYPNASMSNPQDVQKFQQEYNTFYQENFGKPYFQGTSQYAVDGKFGDYTYGAPTIVYPDTYTKKGIQPNTTTDVINPDGPIINRSIGTPIPPTAEMEDTQLNPSIYPNQKSGFNQPLQWYDVAGAIGNYIDASSRMPVNYDPLNLRYSPVKYLNPQPQLDAAKESYNAALAQLPANAVGYANYANLFSKKYQMDNQVLGQYENANNQIYNQQSRYEDEMINRQSQADILGRQAFENKYLTSLDKQSAQKSLSWGDLMDTLQKNRKLNNEGTLAMSLIDYYDQTGAYNNNQYQFNTKQKYNTPTGNLTPIKGGVFVDSKGKVFKADSKTGKFVAIN